MRTFNMNNEERIEAFMNEYKVLCEKYNIFLAEGYSCLDIRSFEINKESTWPTKTPNIGHLTYTAIEADGMRFNFDVIHKI